ncbi:MAG: hypothetical protein U0236_21045 [Nitrospira sp.]
MEELSTLAGTEIPISPLSGGRPRPTLPGTTVPPEAMASGSVSNAIAGQPSIGPVTPPDGPGPTPTPGPSGSGGGSGPPPAPSPGGNGGSSPTPGSGSGQTTTQDQFTNTAASAFLDIIRNASSPQALEAQNIILRRIALQGDVVNSRVPPPRNITEIGGYINLLTTYSEYEMRSQVLAGILGVAGPNPPLGWAATSTAIGFRPMLNDRPSGPTQASLPVTVMVRTDFYDALQTALQQLHDRGCLLPLLSGPLALPPAGGPSTQLVNPLEYLGRVLRIAPNAALADPATDPLALVRPNGSATSFAVAARSLTTGSVVVPLADYDALQTAGSVLASVSLTQAPMVMLGPILGAAGFALAGAVPTVGTHASSSWARFTNIGGLISGETRLGDELALLHDRAAIAASAFAGMQNWRWTGTSFSP